MRGTGTNGLSERRVSVLRTSVSVALFISTDVLGATHLGSGTVHFYRRLGCYGPRFCCPIFPTDPEAIETTHQSTPIKKGVTPNDSGMTPFY